MAGGIRGRKPKPKVIHLLGNPNWRAKAKERRDYPEPKGELPDDPPDWLTFEAAQEWRRVVASMKATGVFAQVDASALAQYCYWFGQFRQFAWEAEGVEPYCFTAMGGLKEHPLQRLVREASRKTLEFAAHLGLTPVARMRLGQDKKDPPEDPFNEHETPAPAGKRKTGRPRKSEGAN